MARQQVFVAVAGCSGVQFPAAIPSSKWHEVLVVVPTMCRAMCNPFRCEMVPFMFLQLYNFKQLLEPSKSEEGD